MAIYKDHRPTPFDRHLDIDWEPSEKLQELYDRLGKATNELNEDTDHEEYWLNQVSELESQVKALEEIEDRNNWTIAPVSITRDSGSFSQSNFYTLLEMLGGECEDVEVHRFGHWGPGWYEIIIVSPANEEKQKIVYDAERSLSDYPILDEEDLSSRELDEFYESWEAYGESDLRSEWKKSVSDRCQDLIDDIPGEALLEWWKETSDEMYFHESDGICIPISRYADRVTRKELARFLWDAKKS